MDKGFESRRRIIDELDVWATLTVEDGQKVVYARCMLGDEALSIEASSTSTHTGAPVMAHQRRTRTFAWKPISTPRAGEPRSVSCSTA
jgi:hypothetical protein